MSRERAAKDLSAIVELQKNDAFNGYFMRRLRDRITRGENSLKRDEMTPEKREALRQQILTLEEVAAWVSQQEAASAEGMTRQ